MKRIFISYRRKSSAFTLLMANKLSQHLEASIFIDFESIDQDNFEDAILTHLCKSDVFLLMVTEHTFTDRIHQDDDWVRREIHEALNMGIPFVLICENGLFPPNDLPDDIREIAKKQGIEFYPAYFDAAVNRLVEFLGNPKFGIPSKAENSPAVKLPVPEARISLVDLPSQIKVTSDNGANILKKALRARRRKDFGLALFLLENLKGTGYQTHLINIDQQIEQIRTAQKSVERKRIATLAYSEIVLLKKFTQEDDEEQVIINAFTTWAKKYPDLVMELDSLKISLKISAPILRDFNPLDWFRLYIWIFFQPNHLSAYRLKYGNDGFSTGSWLVSTLFFLPLLLPSLASTITNHPWDHQITGEAWVYLLATIVLWIITGFLKKDDGVMFIWIFTITFVLLAWFSVITSINLINPIMNLIVVLLILMGVGATSAIWGLYSGRIISTFTGGLTALVMILGTNYVANNILEIKLDILQSIIGIIIIIAIGIGVCINLRDYYERRSNTLANILGLMTPIGYIFLIWVYFFNGWQVLK